jgi:hypothetical protein
MKYERLSRPLLVAVIGLALLSCGGDDDEDDFLYPLSAGNHWEYSRRFTLYYYSDTTGVPQYEDSTTYSFDVFVTIPRKVTLLDTLETYEMVCEETEGSSTYTSLVYYRNERDGLYSYAYDAGGPLVAPRT